MEAPSFPDNNLFDLMVTKNRRFILFWGTNSQNFLLDEPMTAPSFPDSNFIWFNAD
jgi:hypothetical protein